MAWILEGPSYERVCRVPTCSSCYFRLSTLSKNQDMLRSGVLQRSQTPYHTVGAPTSAKTSYVDSSVFFGKRKNLKISLGFRRFKKEASIMKRRNDNYPPYLKQWGT